MPSRVGSASTTSSTTGRSSFNTAGLTFMGLDWANRSSVGLICTQCGCIMELVGGNISVADADADTPS